MSIQNAQQPLTQRAAVAPEITVVIPVYNSEKFIRETIESVLNQSLSNFELILVDSACTDGTREIMDEYAKSDPRIRILTIDVNIGPNKACNLGLANAMAPWATILESDDIFYPDALKTFVEAAKQFPEADFIKGSHSVFFVDGREIETRWAERRRNVENVMLDGPDFFRDVMLMHLIYWAAAYRTTFLREHGIKLREELYINAQDQSFIEEVMLYGKGVYVPSKILHFRMNLGSNSKIKHYSSKIVKELCLVLEDHNRYMEMSDNEIYKAEVAKYKDGVAKSAVIMASQLPRNERSKLWPEIKKHAKKITGLSDEPSMMKKAIYWCYNNFTPALWLVPTYKKPNQN